MHLCKQMQWYGIDLADMNMHDQENNYDEVKNSHMQYKWSIYMHIYYKSENLLHLYKIKIICVIR